jgi:hypothetical protein
MAPKDGQNKGQTPILSSDFARDSLHIEVFLRWVLAMETIINDPDAAANHPEPMA